MATRVTSSRLVGRAPQLAELEAAWRDARDGRASIAFVAGESGVGKSRLLRELVHRVEDEGGRVLSGDCIELGDGELAYAPLVAALRPLARSADPALDALAPDLRAELGAFLPGASGGGSPSEAGMSQGRLFEALLALFDVLTAQTPVLLAVEDLHWADSSTRAFLAFLGRSICSERMLVVASYRADELHRRHPLRPLLAELEREPRSRRIELGPLTEPELAEQLSDILGAPADPALVRRLWLRSDGNPLFTEELLAAGLDGRGGLPATLRDALMVRIERLPPGAQEVVRLIAAGQRLTHDVLADAGDLEPRALRDALREAVASHVLAVDEEDRYAFRHALLREVVQDDLLPGEQAHLHLALAGALQRNAPPGAPGVHLASAIAHHLLAGGDRAAALTASIVAADAAERVHASAEAAGLLERALELWDRVPDAAALTGIDRVELLRRAAHAHDTQNDLVRAELLLDRALELVDEEAEPQRAGLLLERLARARWARNHQEEALATAQRARDLLPTEPPSVALAVVLAWWAKSLMLMGRFRASVETAEQALQAARGVGDVMSQARALNALGVSLAGLGDADAGVAALEEALELARRERLRGELNSTYVNLAEALHTSARSEDAEAVTQRGIVELETFHDPRRLWLRIGLAELYLDLGRTREAVGALPPIERRYSAVTVLYHAITEAAVALAVGDHDGARAHLDRAEPGIELTIEPQFSGQFAVLRGELARREGDLDGARAAVDAGLDRIVCCSDDATRVARVAALGVVVEALTAQRARDLGDAAAAAAAAARAEAMHAYVAAAAGRPIEDALVAGADAALAQARGQACAGAWEAEAQAWGAIGRRGLESQAFLRAAAAAAAADDRDEAARLAQHALDVVAGSGSDWLEREIRGLVARARLRVADPTADGDADTDEDPGAADGPDEDTDPFGLTPRERQVLALVADGATNRQIGEALFMAEKTASVHVSRILAKLDVRSRTQAAAVAHRLGLQHVP